MIKPLAIFGAVSALAVAGLVARALNSVPSGGVARLYNCPVVFADGGYGHVSVAFFIYDGGDLSTAVAPGFSGGTIIDPTRCFYSGQSICSSSTLCVQPDDAGNVPVLAVPFPCTCAIPDGGVCLMPDGGQLPPGQVAGPLFQVPSASGPGCAPTACMGRSGLPSRSELGCPPQ